ncbi:MAG: hypothetical protein IPM29_09150 [Planctomycetes bacterium]|nr:hypothetical protein [Planctomycetota bacterium]
MTVDDDRYLWERSGPVDADVAALEVLLGRFGHAARRRRRRRQALLAGAAASVLLAVALWSLVERPRRGDGALLRVDGRPAHLGETVVAAGADVRIECGDVLLLVARPAAELRLTTLTERELGVELTAGGLDIRLAPSGPRRLRLATRPATIDVVAGAAEVTFERGADRLAVAVAAGIVELAPAAGPRERLVVPAGASLPAPSGPRLGTPRFTDLRAPVADTLDAYDAEPDAARRRKLALAFCDGCVVPRDTLPLWHLLQDGDEKVRWAAEIALAGIAGWPPAFRDQKLPSGVPLEMWRAQVEPLWH